MAHFVQLNEYYVVVRVIVVHNDVITVDGVESESKGIEFCKEHYGEGNWLQTSISGKIRGRFAGPGYFYDPVSDTFIPPRPGPGWVWDEKILDWKDTTPRPPRVPK